MGIFEILGQFLQYLVVWVPRPLLVPSYEAVVIWTMGRAPKLARAFTVFTPLFQRMERYDRRWDADAFEPQMLWTKDGREVSIGVVVVWRVADPIVLATRVNKLQGFVGEIVEAMLPELVGDLDLADFKRKAAGGEAGERSLNARLTMKTRNALQPYGIEVDYARVNFTSSSVRTIKLIGAANGAEIVAVSA